MIKYNYGFKCLLVLVVISLFVIDPAYCAENKKNHASSNPRVGYVDIPALLAFHPYMQYYSYESNAFIRPLGETASKSEFLKQIRERQERYKSLRETKDAEIRKLTEEYATVENEINKLRVKLSREQASLNQKYSDEYTKLTDEKERRDRTEQYHRELSKYEQDYYAGKKKFEELKNKIHDQMNEIMTRLAEIDHLSLKDGEEFFNGIVAEINNAVREAADEKKLPIVLNSNFVSDFINPASIGLNSPQNPITGPDPNNLPVANYSVLIDNIEKLESAATAEAALKSQAIATFCAEQYKRRADVMRLFGRRSPVGQMVLLGGEDLTAAAIDKLLSKHSVPRERINAIVDYVTRANDARQERK